ncbi:MAG: CinA family protein [Planctomycetota bacterium]|nr:CinA family protein [Planctomycetota bacterium]
MLRLQENLDHLARQIFDAMVREDEILVLAESCTAGLIAATLARIPGMSGRLAGSFVTYQVDSKVEWLRIPAETIQQHDVVSSEVASMMASQALAQTPHATRALAITGHLGPNAPDALDGVAWLAIIRRGSEALTAQLKLESDSGEDSPQRRYDRQTDAVLQALTHLLSSFP